MRDRFWLYLPVFALALISLSHPVQATPLLSVTVLGDGIVTSSPQGISCRSDCQERLAVGTLVNLTAFPVEEFVAWGEDCRGGNPTCVVTVRGNMNVTAIFSTSDAQPAKLPVVVDVNGAYVGSFLEFDRGFAPLANVAKVINSKGYVFRVAASSGKLVGKQLLYNVSNCLGIPRYLRLVEAFVAEDRPEWSSARGEVFTSDNHEAGTDLYHMPKNAVINLGRLYYLRADGVCDHAFSTAVKMGKVQMSDAGETGIESSTFAAPLSLGVRP